MALVCLTEIRIRTKKQQTPSLSSVYRYSQSFWAMYIQTTVIFLFFAKKLGCLQYTRLVIKMN